MSSGTDPDDVARKSSQEGAAAAAAAENVLPVGHGSSVHKSAPADLWVGCGLTVYLLAVGCWGGIRFVNLADSCNGTPSTQCTLELAALAGMLGGFVHASQSLVDYIGNGTLHRSWAVWYLVRPVQGAVVGAGFYIIARAGLISNAGEVNVYGVSALGFLGGWFSKNASDKMKEVFQTLFGRGADAQRANKMSGSDQKPSAGTSGNTP